MLNMTSKLSSYPLLLLPFLSLLNQLVQISPMPLPNHLAINNNQLCVQINSKDHKTQPIRTIIMRIEVVKMKSIIETDGNGKHQH